MMRPYSYWRESVCFEQHGFTLLELLVTLALMAILMPIGASSLKQLDSPIQNGTAQVQGFIKQIRAKAISTTKAIEIYPSTSTTIATRTGSTCSGTLTTTNTQTLNLPTGVTLASTTWSVCFSARGLPDSNITFTINDNDSHSRTIEILLGGAVRTV